MKFSLRTALVTSVLAAGLVLTGCSLPGSPVLVTVNLSLDETTNDQADRAASLKGSRLCVVNNSTAAMSIFWRGYPNARDIPAGGRNCNSGYESGDQNPDVSAEISYFPAGETGKERNIHVGANNFWQFPPGALATITLPDGSKKGACHDYSVGVTKFVETGWLHGAMTRLDDSADNKEFEFILTDKVGEPGGEDC